MKKNEWISVAKFLWEYSESVDENSALIKEIVFTLNKNNELIIDEEICTTNGSDRKINPNTTSIRHYNGN
jgi:hypothetical protein